MICRIATPGKGGVPATQWYFDQEALRFLCASDIITHLLTKEYKRETCMRIRELALDSRASCYMADPTSEESEKHVKG